MESWELSKIIRQHEELASALSAHLRTRQAELLAYLDANLAEMQLAELKICITFLLDGRSRPS